MSTAAVMDFEGAKTAAQLGGFEPVPNDDYDVRAGVKEVGLTKNQFPQVVVGWEIIAGPYMGRSITDWIVCTPESTPFVKARLVATKVKMPSKLSAADVAAYIAREMDGKLARITVGTRTRDGKSYNEIINIAPISNTLAKAAPVVAATEVEDEGEDL